VGAAVPRQGIGVADVMLLELLEPFGRAAEAGDLAAEVGEDVLLGWDGPAVHVHVAGVGRDAVRGRAHDGLVLDVGWQPARRLNQALARQALQGAHGGNSQGATFQRSRIRRNALGFSVPIGTHGPTETITVAPGSRSSSPG